MLLETDQPYLEKLEKKNFRRSTILCKEEENFNNL